MKLAYLYALEGCSACDRAFDWLLMQGYAVSKVFVDNPLVELGVRTLFKNKQLHVPVIVVPGVGVYLTPASGEMQLLRIVDLTPKEGEIQDG